MPFGAVAAGAVGAVGEFFIGQAGLAGGGDFLFVGGEDDALNTVLEAAWVEWPGFEVGGGGAVGLNDGLGLARIESALGDGELDDMEVELDGGAVLGKLEIESDAAGALGTVGEGVLALVEVAVELLFAGSGHVAVVPGGHDVSTEVVRHCGVSYELTPKSERRNRVAAPFKDLELGKTLLYLG